MNRDFLLGAEPIREGGFIRVIEGRFTDFHGKVTDLNVEERRLKVVVNMLGRETPVELDMAQVEPLR